MNPPAVLLRRKAMLLWGTGLALVVGVAGAWQLAPEGNAGAAGLGGSSQAASSQGNGAGGGNNGNGGGNGGSTGGSQPGGKALIVDEVVSGRVFPGVPAKVTVTVINPNNQPVILTGIDTSLAVTPAQGRTCAASSFTLNPATSLSIRLEKSGAARSKDRTTVDLWLRLDETGLNQDGCKGAGLSFTYTAKARQA